MKNDTRRCGCERGLKRQVATGEGTTLRSRGGVGQHGTSVSLKSNAARSTTEGSDHTRTRGDKSRLSSCPAASATRYVLVATGCFHLCTTASLPPLPLWASVPWAKALISTVHHFGAATSAL